MKSVFYQRKTRETFGESLRSGKRYQGRTPKDRQRKGKPAENSACYKGLKKFLDEYCDKIGTRKISPSTIGTIIKRYDLTFVPTKLGYLKKRNIKHNFIYLRCPRVNGFVERANRTLQEEFIDLHLNLLLEDIDEFNRRLMNYLLWYNTERHHKSLNKLTSIKLFAKILFIVSYLCNLYKALEKTKDSYNNY